ncbi:MAG: response regulator [Rickettsiales bacterium]|nr:response regulator [Rickettsiales bacterium]
MNPNKSFSKADVENTNVLILDDDDRMVNLLRSTLREFGFNNIRTAATCEKAWQTLQTDKIDMIIVDWELGTDKSGIALVKDVRNHLNSPNRQLPIIMVTGKADLRNVMEAKEVGVSEFLSKPFTVEGLKDRILSVLLKKRREEMTKNENEIITRTQVKKAKQSIEDSKEPMIKELEKEVETLNNLSNKLNRYPYDQEILGDLSQHALSVKSHSGIVGFPFASSIAKSLYNFSEDLKQDMSSINDQALLVLKSHVQTIDIIYRENIGNDGGEIGREVTKALQKASSLSVHNKKPRKD